MAEDDLNLAREHRFPLIDISRETARRVIVDAVSDGGIGSARHFTK
jgi:hypothetical protein